MPNEQCDFLLQPSDVARPSEIDTRTWPFLVARIHVRYACETSSCPVSLNHPFLRSQIVRLIGLGSNPAGGENGGKGSQLDRTTGIYRYLSQGSESESSVDGQHLRPMFKSEIAIIGFSGVTRTLTSPLRGKSVFTSKLADNGPSLVVRTVVALPWL
jgi:hypothetical protein